MTNPYEAPVSESLQGTAQETPNLYSPGQVAWASFLASPIAGSVLMALNYSRVGNGKASKITLLVGGLATVLVFVVALFVPDNFPNMLLPAIYVLGMFFTSTRLQGEAFKRDLPRGHRGASTWAATGIAILCMVVLFLMFAVFLGVLYFLPESTVEYLFPDEVVEHQ